MMAKKRWLAGAASLILMLSLSAFGAPAALAGEAGAAYSPQELNDMYVLGIHSHDWTGATSPSMLTMAPASERSKVYNARIDAHWADLEPSPESYNWAILDNQIDILRSYGVGSILLTVDKPLPAWAQDPARDASVRAIAPPANIGDWKDFCADLAKHMHVDKGDAVQFYEVWNEPGWDIDSDAYARDGTRHFGGQVETEYLPILQAAYQAIKSNDPNSWVIAGALNYSSTNPEDLPRQATHYRALFDDVNRAGLDNSVKIDSDQDIIVERPMYFNYLGAWTGGHDVVGTTTAREAWYFAEGTTRDGFHEYLCLQNPNGAAVSVTVEYMMMPGSGENITKTYTVGANARFTVNVGGEIGTGKDVAMKVTSPSGQPVIAERPMYFNYLGAWTGGHDVMGAAGPSQDWFFAEGTTREGFQEYLCLQNPGSSPTSAKVTFMNSAGQTQDMYIPLAAASRFTQWVNPVVTAAFGPEQDISIQIHADAPIIAERPMYFNYAGAWDGGHDVVGTNSASTSWYFAEGTTRGGFSEFLCMQNATDQMANVNIKFMTGNGEVSDMPVTINPRSRYTTWVNQAIGPEKDVSVHITSNVPIIAERPMYFNYRGAVTGGHDVMGSLGAGRTWYFAEGFAGSGFEQYICLQNPGSADAYVRFTFMMKNGDTILAEMTVPAHSRSTSYINRVLGFSNFEDAVSIHPYVVPENWGNYADAVNQALASNGVAKQLVATEIGWPSYSDLTPGLYYTESEQARILGPDGLGTLWAHGVRKVWIYEDIDPAPGTSWDKFYYGLFRSDGSPKPSWSWYLYWHSLGY